MWGEGKIGRELFFWKAVHELTPTTKLELELYLLHLKPSEEGLRGPLGEFGNTARKQPIQWIRILPSTP